MSFFTKHIVLLPRQIVEGGASRNAAFAALLSESGANQEILAREGKFTNFVNLLRVLRKLLVLRDERIFLHYGMFYSLLGSRLMSSRPFRWGLHQVLHFVARNNLVFFEVNDLSYEQAFDLEMKPNNLREFDRLLFSINTINFVFASSEMRKYACAVYGIGAGRAYHMVNGSRSTDEFFGSNTTRTSEDLSSLNLLYAGTLNKGRQIEWMIQAVKKTDHRLYLMGVGGGWINDLFGTDKQVMHFGELKEMDALRFASSCDLGLIPYDHNRMYYNLCFPTKASFYYSAGIPFVSTPLKELMSHFEAPEAFFLKPGAWVDFLRSENCSELVRSGRETIRKNGSARFHWPTLWCEFLSCVEKAQG